MIISRKKIVVELRPGVSNSLLKDIFYKLVYKNRFKIEKNIVLNCITVIITFYSKHIRCLTLPTLEANTVCKTFFFIFLKYVIFNVSPYVEASSAKKA